MEVSETDPRDVIKIKEKALTTLEERVQRLEDKLAIMTLMAEYASWSEAGVVRDKQVADDVKSIFARQQEIGWSMFTDDVEYRLGNTIDVRVKGMDGVRGQLKTPHGKGYRRVKDGKLMWRGDDTTFRHLMSLPVIRISDDGKEAWLTMHFSGVVTRFDGVHNDKTSHEGTYIHHLVKTDKGWKIKKFVNNSEIAYDPMYHVVEEAKPK